MSLRPGEQTRARRLLQRLEERQDLARPKFDRDEAEHRSRGWVLFAVFGLLASELLVLALAWLWLKADAGTVKDMAAIILSPTFTLLGTIVGFYFSRGS